LHKTHIFDTKLLPTTAVQQKHHVDAVECRMFCSGLILKVKSSPVTGLELPRGFQEVKAPRFHNNGTGWW